MNPISTQDLTEVFKKWGKIAVSLRLCCFKSAHKFVIEKSQKVINK